MAQGSENTDAPAAPATDETPSAATSSPSLFASTAATDPASQMTIAADDALLSPGSSAQLIASLALVLAVIVALGWLSRRLHRLQPRRGGRALKVLDVLPVGARERVALVQVGSTQLVLGLAPGRVQTLHVMDPSGDGIANAASEEEEAPSAIPSPFASLLKR